MVFSSILCTLAYNSSGEQTPLPPAVLKNFKAGVRLPPYVQKVILFSFYQDYISSFLGIEFTYLNLSLNFMDIFISFFRDSL